jgi:alpha-galactosidase
MAFWAKDIEIPLRHGVELMQGENGGPSGSIHALRNITILMGIVEDMKAICPDAWLMNFTNPMSMLCTYLYKYTPIKSLGFCHGVHGSFGVITEMLGFEPGDLQVVTAGINHMNFLLDIRKTGSGKSYMDDFFAAIRKSKYWQKNRKNVPDQIFTLEFLNTFDIYPVGYDNHICEYIPFFYAAEKWKKLGYRSNLAVMQELEEVFKSQTAKVTVTGTGTGTIDDVEPDRILGKGLFPFPKDPGGDYYKETPVLVMEALVKAEPKYLYAMVLPNRGCIANLPFDAVVDIPALVAGGRVHGIEVGELPFFAAELCRRQIAIHELIAQAAVAGDRRLFLEALCLDPFVHSLDTARDIMDDYLKEYREYLPQFFE